MPLEELLILIIALLASAEFGYLSYVAWFRPHQYQRLLGWIGRLYRGWDSFAEKWWTSPVNFWIMRFACLIGFLVATIILINQLFVVLQ
jgi:hypothetical protein